MEIAFTRLSSTESENIIVSIWLDLSTAYDSVKQFYSTHLETGLA